ncbi:MAG: amino acid permease, partial [Streptomyces sp.]|nr:amino acid permease [Streptomyces sp.]
MTVNLAWPRAAVYDPAGGHWYFQWFTVLFLAVTVGLGCLYRWQRAYRGRVSEKGASPAVPSEPS